ncbi:MAG TPA: acyltransferase family protein [Steroidobacteraceae bacterium]|jgi:peptidoglycan/LPS O-acetylase OafA/YrhL
MYTRKYFLDWLRVGAFTLLVLFHVGMLYVTWYYNLKSPRLVPGLEWWMLVLSPWRMALLFVISGVACRFLIGKLGPGQFALDRLRRLLPVILFGMIVVIPPQTYVELVAKNVTHQSYLHFWWYSYLAADQTLVRPLHKTMPTWDHLWFLVYLLVYSLLFALVVALMRRRRSPVKNPVQDPVQGGFRVSTAWLLIVPALWLAAANVLIEFASPRTDDFVHDWGSHIRWIGMFAVGVICARQIAFWDWLRNHRRWLAAAAGVLLVAQSVSNGPVWFAVSGLYAWAAICAICGYAGQYLDRPSALLSHLNVAVLPVYVLHQPILLIAAYWIFPLHLPVAAELLLLAGITLLGSMALYETLIRPFAIMRFMFGVKTDPPVGIRRALIE